MFNVHYNVQNLKRLKQSFSLTNLIQPNSKMQIIPLEEYYQLSKIKHLLPA